MLRRKKVAKPYGHLGEYCKLVLIFVRCRNSHGFREPLGLRAALVCTRAAVEYNGQVTARGDIGALMRNTGNDGLFLHIQCLGALVAYNAMFKKLPPEGEKEKEADGWAEND